MFHSTVAPSIKVSPQNATRNETQSVTFQCILDGKPLSSVTWFHTNGIIDTSNSAKYSVTGPSSVNSGVASLTINNLVRGDEGFYRCEANNILGSAQSTYGYLTVNCKPNCNHGYM